MADQHFIAGTTVPLSLTVKTSAGTAVDISEGYTIDLHYVREEDPDTVVIDKSTTLSDDDEIDVDENGAEGVAYVSLVTADTATLDPGAYTGQWKVTRTSDSVVAYAVADRLVVTASVV